MTKQTYQVKGMHCASCAQIISKQISKIDGIASCDVNFATKQASIQFINQEQDTKKLNQYIEDLGYTLEPMHQIHNATNTVNSQHKHEDAGISKIQLRVIISMVAIVFIMMGRDI
jgi:cation transport ATPase